MHPSPRNLLAAACRIASVLILLLPAACDDSSSPPPDDLPSTPDQDNRSGTRLKLMWEDFDGTKVFLPPVFDSLLNVTCLPQLWSDGNHYCTPLAGEIVYQDAACTMPMGVLEPDECSQTEPPSSMYFSSVEVNSCNGTFVHNELRRGERRSNVPYYTRDSDSGSCIRTTNAAAVLYTLGDAVPTSTFAKLTLDRTGDARIRPTYGVSEDGARIFLANHDTLFEQDCFPFPSFDNQTRQCLALGAAGLQFSDAACTQPKASHQSSCPKPKFAIASDPNAACPFTFHAYRVTEASSSSPLYYPDENQECRPVAARPGISYASVGERVTVQRFERQPPSSSTGPRIQNVVFSDGATSASFNGLRDSQTGDDCEVQQISDGTSRCLPASRLAPTTLYIDSACAQSVQLLAIPKFIPCGTNIPRAVRVDSEDCSVDPQAFTVGERFAGMLYQRLSPTICFPFPSSDLVEHYRVTPVPLTDFAAGTPGRDP